MFGYADLLKEVQLFCHNGIETGIVGESELGRQIPYVFVGKKNGNYMIVQAAIHAREHLTALLALNLAKDLVKNRQLALNGGIYFVPMVNPDGVCLCQQGVDSVWDKERKSNLLKINGSSNFSLWKANADCVDLNVNFDARWGEGEQNEFVKSPQNYVGQSPFSARETRVLANFTKSIKPCVTLSYHLKGEEIYWEFGQTSHRRFRDQRYAKAIANYTGYTVKSTPNSVGGYKDWCVQEFKIPSYTIEVGSDEFSHPFPYSEFPKIFEQNKDLPRRLLNSVARDKTSLDEAGLADLLN